MTLPSCKSNSLNLTCIPWIPNTSDPITATPIGTDAWGPWPIGNQTCPSGTQWLGANIQGIPKNGGVNVTNQIVVACAPNNVATDQNKANAFMQNVYNSVDSNAQATCPIDASAPLKSDSMCRYSFTNPDVAPNAAAYSRWFYYGNQQ